MKNNQEATDMYVDIDNNDTISDDKNIDLNGADMVLDKIENTDDIDSNIILRANNINKSFGSNHVLKDVFFEMKKGEVIAILGSSGGGKSTLLRCLTFLERMDSGSIEIAGEEIVTNVPVPDKMKGKKKYKGDTMSVYPSDSVLRIKALKMGLVFQDFNLFPHKKVIDNLMLAPMLVKGMTSEQAREEAEKQLTKVGLLDKANAYPCEISGGQKQRVAIARALCMNPDILCFDEPTSALDPELTGEVLKVISELRDSGTTMLIVTHEIMFAREVADKVIFLDGGNIIEMDSAKEVIDNPKQERTKAFMNKILKAN